MTNYNKFSPPDSYYEVDCNVEYPCIGCDNLHTKLENAKEFLADVMDMLYSKDRLDTARLENSLDELCYALGMKINPNDLQIQRLKKEDHSVMIPLINEWKTFNKNYLTNKTHT